VKGDFLLRGFAPSREILDWETDYGSREAAKSRSAENASFAMEK